MFLFDADVLSNVMKRAPSPALLGRLAMLPAERQFTTAITVGEIVYGAQRSSRSDYFLAQLEERVIGNMRVLPFDTSAARVYGRLRAELEQRGTSVDMPDLMIAAIAMSREMTVITGNVRHFAKVPGLSVEDWM
jgi:predicted nucleic acid-binding protein